MFAELPGEPAKFSAVSFSATRYCANALDVRTLNEPNPDLWIHPFPPSRRSPRRREQVDANRNPEKETLFAAKLAVADGGAGNMNIRTARGFSDSEPRQRDMTYGVRMDTVVHLVEFFC